LAGSYTNMRQRNHHDVSLIYLRELQGVCVQLGTLVSALVQAALQLSQQAVYRHK
jgi:hypothetical protein